MRNVHRKGILLIGIGMGGSKKIKVTYKYKNTAFQCVKKSGILNSPLLQNQFDDDCIQYYQNCLITSPCTV